MADAGWRTPWKVQRLQQGKHEVQEREAWCAHLCDSSKHGEG